MKFVKFFVFALLLVCFAGSALAAELIVYSSVDEENSKNILSAFEAATGIKISMVFLSSGPALSRIEAEKANPQADVWFGAPNENHIVAKTRGLTLAYVSPEAAKLAKNFVDAEGYWHAFYMNPLGFGVLPAELEKEKKPVPSTWKDLLNPVFAGMIQMPSPQSSGTAYAQMLTLIAIYGEEEAYKYMKALSPNIQTYTQSGTGPAQNLAIGETKVAIQFTPAFLKIIDQGYPAKVVFPTEGVGYEAAAISILKGAKNLEGAKKLVDWALSEAGQKTLSEKKTYFFPVKEGISAGAGVPALSDIKLIDYDREKAAADKKRLVDRWVAEILSQ